MKNVQKTSLVAVAVVAAVSMLPQTSAAAHGKKHHKHAAKHAAEAAPVYAAPSQVESRIMQLESELRSLRAEVSKTRAEEKADVRATSEKIAAHEAAVEEKLEKEISTEGKSLLFFRGGYADMEHSRNDELLTGNSAIPTSISPKAHQAGQGWYVGAGFDHHLTDDIWGLWDGASVAGEVMFEYKNFGTSTNALVNALNATTFTPNGVHTGQIKNQVTQFTLTASPKIKFKTGTNFTPWIIPFGLGIHVISPPSSGVTVLNPGLMVGTGAEYKLWKSLVVGADFRYHFTGGDLSYSSNGALKGVNLDGFTTGGYIGFGF